MPRPASHSEGIRIFFLKLELSNVTVTCVAAFCWIVEQVILDGGQFLTNDLLLGSVD